MSTSLHIDSTQALIDAGRRVVTREAEALTLLAGSLGADFAGAAETLLACKGRVIVSGMGKSGHVARKIAATLASTGTPAHFVHPAEASHGDLGMVTAADVALLLSNSGETPELADLVGFTRRFSIPLIAITGRATGTLARQADVALVLPDAAEACETGIVPTTSTTMALALGDALAVALMQARHFSPEDFRTFHPGGKLGARLLKVADLMHPGAAMPLVPAQSPMGDALLVMSQKSFGVVGVLDANGALTGIITDGDLRRHLTGLMERRADEVMTPAPQVLHPGALAAEALALMNGRKITCLFAVEDGAPKGILHIHDCLRAGVA